MANCDRCGDGLHGIRDIAFPMPFDIAALSESDRKERAKTSPDFCRLDDLSLIHI